MIQVELQESHFKRLRKNVSFKLRTRLRGSRKDRFAARKLVGNIRAILEAFDELDCGVSVVIVIDTNSVHLNGRIVAPNLQAQDIVKAEMESINRIAQQILATRLDVITIEISLETHNFQQLSQEA